MSLDDRRVMKKDRLEGFLESLLKDNNVFGPVRKGNMLLFEQIESVHNIALEPGNTMNSAKDALFPQTERLFAYRHGESGVQIDGPSVEEKGLVLFGVRPCDARGIVLLDKVFGGPLQDPYYVEKRARTVVIGMACATPDPKCFCIALGGGPCSTEGSDLLLLDLGDRYLVKAESPKGIALLQDRAFEKADKETHTRADLVEKKAEESMNKAVLGKLDVGEALEKRLETLFNDPIWDDITESCLGCGICTYLCPTCHCFDILDEAGQSTGERIRIWDSCQFSLFTHQASGVNPRPSAKERFRQRIMHKLCYLPQNGNLAGCVGCGRCVTECPVNLDIREVIQKISAREAE
jgi:sulfhydrogenase subunit beta (sulfur reductase)